LARLSTRLPAIRAKEISSVELTQHTLRGRADLLESPQLHLTGDVTGCPATTAPAGLSRSGLPVGLQIVGPYLEDATPIAFARLLAQEIGGFHPPTGYEL